MSPSLLRMGQWQPAPPSPILIYPFAIGVPYLQLQVRLLLTERTSRYVIFRGMGSKVGRFCGIVVRVLGYRSRDPGSIPGATRFTDNKWVWKGVRSVSWVQLRKLLGRKSSGSGLESREYGRRDPSRWPRGPLYQQKLALTSPTRGGPSVGIVRLRTQATDFSCYG
jgi:hypothetical protein